MYNSSLLTYCRVTSGVRRHSVTRNLRWLSPVLVWDDWQRCERYIQRFITYNMYIDRLSTIILVQTSVRSCNPVAEWPLPVVCRSPDTWPVNYCFWHAASELHTRPYGRLYCCATWPAVCRRPGVQFGPVPNKIIKKNKTVAVWQLSHLTLTYLLTYLLTCQSNIEQSYNVPNAFTYNIFDCNF